MDVDGVLHSLYGQDLFRDSCCRLLESVVRASGASLVLSSSWRVEPSKVAVLNGVLHQRGLAPVIDMTRELSAPREYEICEWLDRNPGVQRWVVIDDVDLQSGASMEAMRMRGRFVRTNHQTGLVPQDADLAIRLLIAQGSCAGLFSPAHHNLTRVATPQSYATPAGRPFRRPPSPFAEINLPTQSKPSMFTVGALGTTTRATLGGRPPRLPHTKPQTSPSTQDLGYGGSYNLDATYSASPRHRCRGFTPFVLPSFGDLSPLNSRSPSCCGLEARFTTGTSYTFGTEVHTPLATVHYAPRGW